VTKETNREKQLFTDDPDYDLRFSELTDEPFLKEQLLDEGTRVWYPPSSESDINIFVRNWAGFARYNCSLTAIYKGEIIGMVTIFLMPYVKVAHLAMAYMIVKKEFRRKGVGKSLLKNINHLAKTKFKLDSMHFEIFEGCCIEPLLKQGGYKLVFQQDNFVELFGKLKARLVYEMEL